MDKDAEIKSLKEKNDELLKLYSNKSDMVSVSVHQVRTSLSALKWIIRMFLDGDLGKLTIEQENLMRKADEGNDRAIGIVNELLLTNKTENAGEKEYDFEKVDIIELINGSIFNFSGEAYIRGIEIIFLSSVIKIPEVKADKEKLRIVLENLLENAIKYSNYHGKIFVSIKVVEETVEVSIKDTGVGMSEEGKKRIFEKFYRDPAAQKKERVGSGIGLFTCKNIVEKHGGKIWFDSSDKEGSTFFITIPIFK